MHTPDSDRTLRLGQLYTSSKSPLFFLKGSTENQ